MDLSLHNPIELVAKLVNSDLDARTLRRTGGGCGSFSCAAKARNVKLQEKAVSYVYGLTWAAFCALTLVRLPSPIYKETSGLWIDQVLSKHNVQFTYLRKLEFLIFNVAIISVPTPGRRWHAEDFFAQLKSAMPDYKHQEKTAPHAYGLIRNDLPSVVALTGDN